MQAEIDDRLAMALLAGTVRDGDLVRVDLAEDGDSLTVASARVPTADSTFGEGDEGLLDEDLL